MATLSFSCPKCGKLHERVNSGMVGFKVQCKCGFVFRLGSKADKDKEFGEIIRKKKELKRKTAEAAALTRSKNKNLTFDLLPKFDPLDPNREDVTSPSNEVHSPISSSVVSEMGDFGSIERQDFHLPPPIPDELENFVETTAVEPADGFTEPESEAFQKGSTFRSERQFVSGTGSEASVDAIPDDLLTDLEGDRTEFQPSLPSSNGVIREPSKVVKGRYKPLRSKSVETVNGSGSVLFSYVGLGLSITLTPVCFLKLAGVSWLVNQRLGEAGSEAVDATLGGLAGFAVLDLAISVALVVSLLVTGFVAGLELVKSKLYHLPWIIQGSIAGIGLVWGCIYCGVEWQSGSTFLGLAFTFFLVGLAPLMMVINSLMRLILR